MPTRRDLRDSFDRIGTQIESDVPRHLHQTLRAGHRRRLLRRAVGGVTVAAIVASLAIGGPAALHWFEQVRTNTPGATPSRRPSPIDDRSALVGTYTVTIVDTPGPIRDQGMAGSWTLRLEDDGTVLLSSPTTFTASITGVVFDATRGQFRTNAFVTDLCGTAPSGLYRWDRSGGVLRFTVVADPCAPRVALFASRPWRDSA